MFKCLAITLAVVSTSAFAQSGNPAITTGQYNNGRTSANSNETVLNTSNVNVNQFGKLASWVVDGWVFAQPLYMPGVQIQGASRNVVYVATMNNSVYAFDASNPGGTFLWKKTLEPAVQAPGANGCVISDNTGPVLGILSTPVIDPSTNTLYAVTTTPAPGGYVYFLHALDITTGNDKTGSPVQIQASVPGTGYDNVSGTVTLSPSSMDVQRTSLLLANGSVYAGFGSCGADSDPWHGWIVGYSTTNLSQRTAVFNSTPNGGEGGIWQSGRGPVADSSGALYFTTGNATPGNTTTGSASGDAAQNDYPMRFVQLSSSGQFLGSYPPPNYPKLNNLDMDFSSSGPLLIPNSTSILAGGKDGNMYMFNPTSLSQPQQVFQVSTSTCPLSTSDSCSQIHDLAFWNSQLYVWPSNDVLRAFKLSNGQFGTSPSSQNTIQVGYHPATLAVSGNVSQSGIVWALTPDNTVHAFDASNVATELWNSNQNKPRDGLPSFPRFTEPTVANGRVYVATQSGQVVVYGLLNEFSLAGSPASQNVTQGGSTTFTVSLTALAGFSPPVSFSVSGLPSGATGTFNPSSLSASGSTTLTINANSSTPTGTYSLIISGTGGGVTHTANVSLVVITPTSDTTPPQWSCCGYSQNGSSFVLTFSAWDTQSGLQSITVVQEANATVSIPSFPVGTNSVVNFTATESGWSSYVKFQLTDVAGNVSFIDPIFFVPEREPGTPQPFFIKDVTNEEGVITIVNGSPGVKNLRITVGEDHHHEVAGLKDGEVRVIDVTSELPSSISGVTVTLTPLGKPGGSAVVVLANVPMTP